MSRQVLHRLLRGRVDRAAPGEAGDELWLGSAPRQCDAAPTARWLLSGSLPPLPFHQPAHLPLLTIPRPLSPSAARSHTPSTSCASSHRPLRLRSRPFPPSQAASSRRVCPGKRRSQPCRPRSRRRPRRGGRRRRAPTPRGATARSSRARSPPRPVGTTAGGTSAPTWARLPDGVRASWRVRGNAWEPLPGSERSALKGPPLSSRRSVSAAALPPRP